MTQFYGMLGRDQGSGERGQAKRDGRAAAGGGGGMVVSYKFH